MMWDGGEDFDGGIVGWMKIGYEKMMKKNKEEVLGGGGGIVKTKILTSLSSNAFFLK